MKCPKLALLFLLQLPLTANASVFTVEYVGHLTDRRTEGYDFPELIQGVLSFDLAGANDRAPSSYWARYEIGVGQTDFVTGYLPPQPGFNQDGVNVDDGNHPDHPLPSEDAFSVLDGNIADNIYDLLVLSVEVTGADWVHGNQIPEVTFDGSQLSERSDVRISRYSFNDGNGGPDVDLTREAYYDLDFISINAVSVSEPGTLLLTLGGLLALSARRFYAMRSTQ